MKHSQVAAETLAIVADGRYTAPSGVVVELGDLVEDAVAGGVLYPPRSLDGWTAPERPDAAPPQIVVTDETTAAAARRLVAAGEDRVAALNFASARNPGGGFQGEAKAQEEDLARCSALYACQIEHPRYYEANRAHKSLLYTDHLIYSPDVPFFRDDRLRLIDAPFLVSIVTAPAPNRGAATREDAGPERVRETLRRRAGLVLAAMAKHGHRCLVLGAWGCGVFRNDPAEVAEVFAGWLEDPRFRGCFDRVVFAVFDRSAGRVNLGAFRDRFAAAA